MIGRAVRAGRLRPVFRGVYAPGHVALRREGWWMAALLACGPGSALSHRSAATLLGLRPDATWPIEVATTGGRGRKRERVVAHRILLREHEAMVRDGLRVTTPARTLVDLAARLDPPLAARGDRTRAGPGTLRRRRDPRRARASAAAARHPPARRPDRARATRRGQPRSHLERLFLSLVRSSGLPRPEVNSLIAGRRRDFA